MKRLSELIGTKRASSDATSSHYMTADLGNSAPHYRRLYKSQRTSSYFVDMLSILGASAGVTFTLGGTVDLGYLGAAAIFGAALMFLYSHKGGIKYPSAGTT